MGRDATSKRWKHLNKGKGKKMLRVTTVGRPKYMPIKVPLSRDAHLQAMAVGLEAANAVLPSSLCANPMLPWRHARHLQGYIGKPVCSTEG